MQATSSSTTEGEREAHSRVAVGGHGLLTEYLSNRAAYWVIGAFLLMTLADATLRQQPFLPTLAPYFERALRVMIIALCGIVFVASLRVVRARPQRPLSAVCTEFAQILRSLSFGRYATGCIALVVFMAAFLFNKMRIPDLVPFSWDVTFAEWDRAVFLGNHPWELLQPVLGFPAVTILLDYFYSAWAPLVFIFWLLVMSPALASQQLRTRYWLATILSWIVIGLVLATLLSSAGPCYFVLVVPDAASPYADLEAYLASVSENYVLASGLLKEYLWHIHSGLLDAPGGISAMPSMHNAQAALFALVAYRIDRRLGHLMLGFAVIIFVGSIHLGWHYAIDGFVGIAAAIALWWLAGVLAHRIEARNSA